MATNVLEWLEAARSTEKLGTGEVCPDTPAEIVTGPTFGPWADHGPNCRCNVCR